jgi:hypothetical protein
MKIVRETVIALSTDCYLSVMGGDGFAAHFRFGKRGKDGRVETGKRRNGEGERAGGLGVGA